jgi:hypothetical protein
MARPSTLCSPPRLLLSLLLPAALALAACDAPVVGSWQSDVKLTDGTRNMLAVNSDLSGDAKIHATPANNTLAWVSFRFNFTGTESEDGMSWRFYMSCASSTSGPCNGDDFKMDCQVVDEGTGAPIKMECEGNNRWAPYPFDWEEVIE